MGCNLGRWDVQFYLILSTVSLFVFTGALPLGVDYAISGFLGAVIVSLNFAVLIALGKYFFKNPKKQILPVFLLVAHVFIVPGTLYILIRFMDINTIALLLGALVSAAVSPLAMAVIGLMHANNNDRFSLAAVRSGNDGEGQ